MENKDESRSKAWPDIAAIVKQHSFTRMDIGFQAGGFFPNAHGGNDHYISTAWGSGIGGRGCVTAYGATPVEAAIRCINKARKGRIQKDVMTSAQQTRVHR